MVTVVTTVVTSSLHRYLHVKIEGGETTSMLCPAYECYKFIPVVCFVFTMVTLLPWLQDIVHKLVSSKMEKKFLTFDLKVCQCVMTSFHMLL